jgi:hypothetical protein
MDFLTFWGLILLAFLLVSVGTIFLSYWIPKKMEYRKIGVIVSRTLMVAAVIGILTIVFSDKLFFKSDVNEILGRHNIKLKDDFKIISNSSGGFMDYYHTFELSISQADKKEIIDKINASKDFVVDTKNNFYLPDKTDRYSDTTIEANYENDSHFKRESYQTFEQGHAPTHEIISVDKTFRQADI